MEYTFGKRIQGNITTEMVKTKDTKHSDLKGSITIERRYPDNIITDVFDVRSKYLSKEDSEGNCYDWYIIDNHYRYMDKYSPDKDHIEEMTTENSDGVLDVASLADENNEAITDLADYIAEIESRVEALEG